MLKFITASILCIFFLNSVLAQASNSSELLREKRGAFLQNYYYYPYQYYHWYNYVYPSYQFTVATCSASYSCPTLCPGTCGVWSGLGACRCNSCPIVGNVCNYANIQRGFYLHAYPYDQSRYVQCDSTPGVIYIRTCPSGLVFDARFSVCNYPTQVYYAYASHWKK